MRRGGSSNLIRSVIPSQSAATCSSRPNSKAEAKYRSVRTFVMKAIAAVEAELAGNDKRPGAKTTQDARLGPKHHWIAGNRNARYRVTESDGMTICMRGAS